MWRGVTQSLRRFILARMGADTQWPMRVGLDPSGAYSSSGVAPLTDHEIGRNANVQSIAGMLCNSIAQFGWWVEERTGRGSTNSDAAQAHYLNGVLQRPNQAHTGFRLRRRMVRDLVIYGKCVVSVERHQETGRATRLIPFDPCNVEIATEGGRPVFRERVPSGGTANLDYDPARTIWAVDTDTENVNSPSRFQMCPELIRLDNSLQDLLGGTFKEGLHGSHYAYSERTLDKTERETLRQSIASFKAAGGAMAGGIPIAEGYEFKKLERLKPTDADLLAFRKQLRIEIAHIVMMPPSLANEMGNTNFNNSRNQFHVYKEMTLGAVTQNLEEAMTATLFPGDRMFAIRFDKTQALTGDLSAILPIAIQAYQSGLASMNEARRMCGLPALSDEEVAAREEKARTNPKVAFEPPPANESGREMDEDQAPDRDGDGVAQ